MDHGQGLDGGGLVGGVQVFGCLAGGFCLLVVVAGVVPVLGCDDGQEQGVEEDREEGSVLGRGFTNDRLDGPACGLGLLVAGADPGAAGTLECCGCLGQLGPVAGGGDEGRASRVSASTVM